MNYKTRFMQAMSAAGYATTTEFGSARMTFTHLRKSGVRRFKLWFGYDVWESSPEKQERLEAELKKAYGAAYLKGYFIAGPRGYGKSFCVLLDQAKLKD